MLGLGLVASFACRPSALGVWMGTAFTVLGLVWLYLAATNRWTRLWNRVAVGTVFLACMAGAIFYGWWAANPPARRSAPPSIPTQSTVLSDEQRHRLVDALRMSPAGKITIVSLMNDADNKSSDYAHEIRGVLVQSGWDTKMSYMFYLGPDPGWLSLQVRSLRSRPPRSSFLEQAFRSAGIACGWKEDRKMQEDDLTLMVGGKPFGIIAHDGRVRYVR
jgi:hypothetical protein